MMHFARHYYGLTRVSLLAAASSTTYVFVRGVTLNLLERDDAWGGALGGFAAGSVLGLPCMAPPPPAHNLILH